MPRQNLMRNAGLIPDFPLVFSKKLANLEAAVAMFLAYDNFVWRTQDANEGRTRLPAEMAVGVTDTLMSFEELFDRVMGNVA